MNLEGVIVPEYGLQQDDWSLTNPIFGEQGHLKVIGWSGRQGTGKLYLLKCSICSQDTELFGQGVFRSIKSSLIKGAIPCGCAKRPKWSKEQFTILCSRKAQEFGYEFIGFNGEWKGYKTKITMSCDKHGEWSSGIINNLTTIGNGCPGCAVDVRREAARQANTKPDSVMIQSFFDSGCFHPDTKFWRSNRLNSQGCTTYWYMSCPECGAEGESFVGDLQAGKRSCMCSPHRQKECYINWVYDDNNQTIAIKFGVANNSKRRAKEQASKCVYNMRQGSIWAFPSKASCLKAERRCLNELECGVLSKEEMPDGWTETTYPYNVERIMSIYEEFGGVVI